MTDTRYFFKSEETSYDFGYGVTLSMREEDADLLTASIRHVVSGGSVKHNEATPLLEFLTVMLRERENR